MIEGMQLERLVWNFDEEDEDDMPSYTADFETTVLEDDCRVWAWATCRIGDEYDMQFGNDIGTFLEWCRVHCGCKVYFHNLKFDGKFILHRILSDGWRWVPTETERASRTFSTLISDMNQWYSVRLFFDESRSVEFLDSLKVIPLPISAIPKAFGLDVEKLDMDYVAYREVGHELTEHERDYIAHDVIIAAKAMGIMLGEGMRKMTAGSNAFADYKRIIGGSKRFRDWFPVPDYDKDLRDGGCYKGGFTAVNPKFAGIEVGNGISFDVNSLYPSVMAASHGEVLPFGEPVYFEGEYVHDPEYPLYIQYVEADFTVKDGHIPCLQLKGNMMFAETEYISDSKGLQTLCLTSVDLGILFEQYDVWDIRYIRGYKFKGSTELFKEYVSKWTEVKIAAGKEGNQGMRTIAKLQLNSLYGKLATNPVKQSRMPYLEDGIVKYALTEPEEKEPQYLPAGAFITSYARRFTVRAAQANYERWLYCDTDSVYLLGDEPPREMLIDAFELGAWKQEHSFDRFKAIRAKTYCFEENGELTVHCAGMPAKCHENVTMENFEPGSSFEGKLKPKDVKGGIILVDDVFTIRE